MTEKDLNILNSFALVANEYCKILQVNLAEDAAYPIHVVGEEPVSHNSFSSWIEKVRESGTIIDIADFEKNVSMNTIHKAIEEKGIFTYIYKRKINGVPTWVCMQAMPTETYSTEDPIAMMFVRSIQPFIEYVKNNPKLYN